ncbi:uncharacterized protein LOC129591477 [Paramacrobiotus metropolitanus]|uniref:uncharacterized protein LOC129591477 n=1 Tax=Paramacrobiotus metropolitanus TaxID=2943436 RepID=UPI002446077A|nr:uncharacterized protein LOC129591477 [Paramacrobiotus metropolitanus]
MHLPIVTLTALFASAVAAETCEELKARCDTLSGDGEAYFQRMAPYNATVWPVSAADLKQLQATGEQFCKWNTDSAKCIQSVYSQCSKDDVASAGGWYDAEYRLSFGALCRTAVGPVKYLRAVRHCIEKDEDALDACCNGLDAAGDNEKDENATDAHKSFCNKLKATVSYFDGKGFQNVAGTCGADAAQTFKDVYKQLLTAHCKK